MKIQDDSSEQSPQSFSKPISKSQSSSKNNRKYNKITHDLRMKFLDKIFFENKSIKKAAQELNINYSSAKTILNLHRKKQRFQQQPLSSVSDISSEIDASKMCGFSSQTLFKKQKLELVVTLGGRLMNSNKIDPNTTQIVVGSSSSASSCSSSALPSVNLYKQGMFPTISDDIFLQQQQQHNQQQHQLLLKLLQEQQMQEQQRLVQQQQLQQQLILNPELYSLFLEKQKQQDQQQMLIAQLLTQQQQQQHIQQQSLSQQKSSSAFGLF